MDEIHSWLLISDPDTSHALNALQHGADFNPPVYYFVARTFHTVVPLNEHNLRVLSALLTIGTAIGLALVFARRMSWLAAVGASLLLCSQSLLLLQSTEARFYALWLCLLTWFCLLLTSRTQIPYFARLAGLTILATLIAGTHYFGVISVGLTCSAFIVAQRFSRRSIITAGISMLSSLGTVGCCLPLLRGQKAVLTVSTWVKPTTSESAVSFVTQFFPALLIMVACAIWLIGLVLNPTRLTQTHNDKTSADEDAGVRNESRSDKDMFMNSDLYVFGSLLMMPFVLIVFSAIVQPALVNRYAVVATLWLVPLFSLLLKTTDSRKGGVVFFAGCLMFAFGVHKSSATWQFNLAREQQLRQHLNEIPDGELVLFEDRIDFWLAQHRDPNESWFQLNFESADADELRDLRIVQRDVGRAIQPLYPGRFPMKSLQECSEMEFYLVPYDGRKPQSAVAESGRKVTQFNGSVYKIVHQ